MPRARRKRSSFRAVGPSKMATVKSLEDMLSSEVDEPTVNALVASLESQLASTNAQQPNQDVSSAALVNHVNSIATGDGNTARSIDGPKLVFNAATPNASAANGTKCTGAATSQFIDVLPVTTNSASSVIVTLPEALPASGYITQVTGTSQPAFFNPSGGAAIAVSRPLTTSSQDIKIVYTTQSVVTPTLNNIIRNQKNTTVSNGCSTSGSMITVRPNQPLVSASTVNPVISTSVPASSLSAMHDLATIASQQTPIIIPNSSGSSETVTQITNVSALTTQTKSVSSRPITRMQLRDRGNKNSNYTNSPKTVNVTRSQENLTTAVTIQSNNVVTTAIKAPPTTTHHVNVVSQVVTNSSILPPGVQIINVNPRLGAASLSGKTLAPRVLVTNPVRIAAAPQIMTTRPGVAGQIRFL